MFKNLLLVFTVFSIQLSAYIIQDVNTLNYHSSEADGINNHGQIAGRIKIDSSKVHYSPFYLDEHSNIQTLDCSVMSLMLINNNGLIAGSFSTGWASPEQYPTISEFLSWSPFFWNPAGVFTDAGKNLHSSFFIDQIYPISLNDEGQILTLSQGNKQYVVDSKGEILRTEYKKGWNSKFISAINNQHQLLSTYVSKGMFRDYFYQIAIFSEDGSVERIPELNDHFGLYFNDHQQIVGVFPDSKDSFFWDPQLGLKNIPGFRPRKINNSGVVIGRSTDGKQTPLIWDKESGLRQIADLIENLPNNEVWESILDVKDINDQGEIVGVGITKSKQEHGFVLKNSKSELHPHN